MGVTETVARFALATRTIPDDVRMLATNYFVDGIAVMLAGAITCARAWSRRLSS